MSDIKQKQERAAFVRRADPDRYLASLFAPADKRDALLVLYAFNIELASIRDKVSEALPGEIRLQWWRDVLSVSDAALASDANDGAGHPLAVALLDVIKTYDLPRKPFIDMTEARIFDLYDDPMPDRDTFEGYCGETASTLIQLSALILDAQAATETAAIAGHAGCAQAIAGLARSLPIHLRRHQCFVPVTILNAVGMSRDAFVSGDDIEGQRRAVNAFIALGEEHMAAFQSDAKRLPASLYPAYLPLALTGLYLQKMSKHKYDVARDFLTISPLRRYLAVLWRAFRGW